MVTASEATIPTLITIPFRDITITGRIQKLPLRGGGREGQTMMGCVCNSQKMTRYKEQTLVNITVICRRIAK
jgi:hypothetical protein